MLVVFGLVGTLLFQNEVHKASNNYYSIERNYWSEMANDYSLNKYCMKQGIHPYSDFYSPEEMIYNFMYRFRSITYDNSFCENTYMIVKCYDSNNNLVAESANMLELDMKEEDEIHGTRKYRFLYPDKSFSQEQLEQIYSFQNQGNTRITRIDGYYHGDEIIMTGIKIVSPEGMGELEIRNETEQESIVIYQEEDKDCSVFGVLLKTMAAKRTVSYQHSGLPAHDFLSYFAEKYAAMRADAIRSFNENQFNGIDTSWVDGTDAMHGTVPFIYNEEEYTMEYAITTDMNYTALVNDYFIFSIASIFWLLQGVGVICMVILTITFKRLKRLEQAKVVLTNGVAHEMKTPLAVIKNYGECILENVSPDKNKYYLDSILNESDRMNDMVMNMLNFTKYSNRDYQLNKQLCALDELVVEVLKEKDAAIKHKSLNIKLTCQGDMEVFCDESLIKLVIENYITNAIEHTANGKKIEIRLEESRSKFRSKLTCHVINEGIMIHFKEQDLIWDAYYRGDKARNRKNNSTGFGLAICKSIMKLHKGKYGCTSMGIGMDFYFTLYHRLSN